MYKIIAICGKSGSGKDKVLKEVLSADPSLHKIVHFTSRPQRENEIDGEDYHFITRKEAVELITSNNLIEATMFNDWMYGTTLNGLDESKVNIGIFSLNAIDYLQYDPRVDLRICYITCDDKERLLRQLNREAHPDVNEIVRRYSADEKDFQFIQDEFELDLVMPNEDHNSLYELINAILDLVKFV